MRQTTSSFLFLCSLSCAFLLISTGMANAQLIVLETHSCNFSSALTPWEDSCTVPLYSGSQTLEEVMVTLSGNADGEVRLNNETSRDATVVSGFIRADILASWSIAGQNLTLNALPTGEFAGNGTTISVPPTGGGTPTTLQDVMGSDTAMATYSGASNPDVSLYNGNGTFTLDVDSTGLLGNLTVSGGNVIVDQDTLSDATFTIQYKGTPEPHGALIGFFGVLGVLGFVRRRR